MFHDTSMRQILFFNADTRIPIHKARWAISRINKELTDASDTRATDRACYELWKLQGRLFYEPAFSFALFTPSGRGQCGTMTEMPCIAGWDVLAGHVIYLSISNLSCTALFRKKCAKIPIVISLLSGAQCAKIPFCTFKRNEVPYSFCSLSRFRCSLSRSHSSISRARFAS
jgi:hypothetical protein